MLNDKGEIIMALVETIEISGEEREIADAVARGQINGINSNLTDLAFGENSGSANIFNGKIVGGLLIETGEVGGWTTTRITSDFIPVEPNTLYTQIAPTSAKGGRYCEYDANKNLVYFDPSGLQDTLTTKPTTKYLRISFGSEYGTTFKNDIAIIKGNATEYVPYIMSNKQLGALNESLEDQKMLGWSVPKECPIQNSTNGNAFTQNVERVLLDNLSFEKPNADLNIYVAVVSGLKHYSFKPSGFISGNKYKLAYKDWKNCENNEFNLGQNIIAGGPSVAIRDDSYTDVASFVNSIKGKGFYLYYELDTPITTQIDGNEAVTQIKNDLSKQCKKDDVTTNETLIGTFNGKNYYRKLFTGISGSGGSVTVNVGGKIEIYNYYGRAYMYGQSGASDVKYPIPNKNYYIESQSISETSFQLTIPTSSDMRKIDLVIEYTKVDE